MLSLDPETEKHNLERERGTVFDENAPKTGPLPNEGKVISDEFESGNVVREVLPEDGQNSVEETNHVDMMPANRPQPPHTEQPSTGNNPEDFGMPKRHQDVQTSLHLKHYFNRHGNNDRDNDIIIRTESKTNESNFKKNC